MHCRLPVGEVAVMRPACEAASLMAAEVAVMGVACEAAFLAAATAALWCRHRVVGPGPRSLPQRLRCGTRSIPVVTHAARLLC